MKQNLRNNNKIKQDKTKTNRHNRQIHKRSIPQKSTNENHKKTQKTHMIEETQTHLHTPETKP